MSTEEKIIVELTAIKKILAGNQSDYCDSEEACRIIGVSNYRYLGQLFRRELLPRYARGDHFKYKKTDCYKIAAALDRGEIALIPLGKK